MTDAYHEPQFPVATSRRPQQCVCTATPGWPHPYGPTCHGWAGKHSAQRATTNEEITMDRQPFEVADTPDVRPLDYVRFHAIIETREDVFVKAKTPRGKSGNRNVKVAVPKSGAGQVRRISTTGARAVPPRHLAALADGDLEVLSFRTARVDTGPLMGVVTAILNGAECTGRQLCTDDAVPAAC